jgi:hypothetical protein
MATREVGGRVEFISQLWLLGVWCLVRCLLDGYPSGAKPDVAILHPLQHLRLAEARNEHSSLRIAIRAILSPALPIVSHFS